MNLHTRISTALQTGKLRSGGLLVVEHSSSADREKERERIYLTSHLEETALTHLLDEGDGAVVSTEILGVSDDWCAWVVSYTAAGVTHRAVVPLFGQEAAGLIERAVKGDVFLIFTSSERADAALETKLRVTDAELGLLRQHWRPHFSEAAPERLLQTLDILLSPAHGSKEQVESLALVVPADLQAELSELMPEFRFE